MSDPIVIVGSGAAGLTLACELGPAGVPTVVLERRSELLERSGGMFLNAHIADFLRKRGLEERFRTPDTPTWGRSHFGLVYRDIDGELAETDYDLIVPQWRSEQLLRERAVELGVEVRLGQEVIDIEQDADGVTLTVVSPEGSGALRASGGVHSSWFPGVHTTLAKRSPSSRTAHSMSGTSSPMSPAMISQS
ncbi:2-polyprenyl-6-methoxyphenol hydroxylase-like FAD-dependent oxidoreductase [Streptomyces sp. TE3672]